MAHREKSNKRPKPKIALRLPDLEHSKTAVLNSLPAVSSQESYGHAIDEFIGWASLNVIVSSLRRSGSDWARNA